jgi:class 3 adenylate cyclase
MTAEPPSGTVTFVFTDVEGSTALWQDHPRAMAATLAHHDEIVRGAIEKHDGYVFSTAGDAFAAAFASAIDAVSAIAAAQADLADEPWAEAAIRRRRPQPGQTTSSWCCAGALRTSGPARSSWFRRIRRTPRT